MATSTIASILGANGKWVKEIKCLYELKNITETTQMFSGSGKIIGIKANLKRHVFRVISIQQNISILLRLTNLSARKITQYDEIFISNLILIVKN